MKLRLLTWPYRVNTLAGSFLLFFLKVEIYIIYIMLMVIVFWFMWTNMIHSNKFIIYTRLQYEQEFSNGWILFKKIAAGVDYWEYIIWVHSETSLRIFLPTLELWGLKLIVLDDGSMESGVSVACIHPILGCSSIYWRFRL